jgi:hypothetical protein
MKVLTIEERQTKITDERPESKPFWRCVLEDDDRPLLVWTKPQFAEGTDLVDDSLELKGKEGNQYWAIKAKPKSSGRAFTKGRTPNEQASIERQSARRDAVELYKHCVCREVPFDSDLFFTLYTAMLVITNSNREGGR